MADDDLNFDFESNLEQSNQLTNREHEVPLEIPPQEVIGQQPGNYRKNFRQTVCTYWLRGLCMKGEQCGFLHQYDKERMPVCRTLLKFGECKEPDCPFKHDTEEIKECNMYKLGFCIYGPQCRYKHRKLPGPPPDPEGVEAAKPKDHRDINKVVNSVNPGVLRDDDRPPKRRFGDRDRFRDGDRQGYNQPLALPAPPPGPPPRPAPPPGEPPKPLPPPGSPPRDRDRDRDHDQDGRNPDMALNGMPDLMPAGHMPPMGMPQMMGHPGMQGMSMGMGPGMGPGMGMGMGMGPGMMGGPMGMPGMGPGMPFDPAMMAMMSQQGFPMPPFR